MKLFIARHGETAWNVASREMGQLDSPLTDRGVEQARALARRLAGLHVEVVYSSDLGRALRTAELIARECGIEVRVEPALRERHMGIFQGLTRAEMHERYPAERTAYETGGYDHVIPGGESARQRTERSVRALTDMRCSISADASPSSPTVASFWGSSLMCSGWIPGRLGASSDTTEA
jgi:2,3-bisphosphoglycerate-dependent phosphoglycerate mutase